MAETISKSPNEKYCTECGALIRTNAEICPKCGVRQSPSPSANSLDSVAPNGKSKLAAALFALFLGGIGVHKFYLGKIGWGIAYLLFCWTGIPAIAGLVEGIILLVMSDANFNRKFGNC